MDIATIIISIFVWLIGFVIGRLTAEPVRYEEPEIAITGFADVMQDQREETIDQDGFEQTRYAAQRLQEHRNG